MNRTKRTIVKTALKLFLQKGFYSVSMNMIAAEVGISKPAIYHHFSSKDNMVEGVLDYFTERMRDWSKEYYADIQSGEDFLKRMFKAIPIYKDVENILLDETAGNYPYSYNDLLTILSKYKPEFRTRIAQDLLHVRQILEENISQAQDENFIRPELQPSRLAMLIHTIIEGTAFICELDPNLKIQWVADEVYNSIMKMVSTKS